MSERLRTLQRELVGVMLDSRDSTLLVAQLRGDARAPLEERLAVYAGMYVARLVEVLAEVYPLTARWLGDDAHHVFSAYVRTHPSRSPSLRSYGASLGTYLDLEARGAVAALARLEWARYDVFDAADDLPLTRERLAALPPDAYATLPVRAIRASALIEVAYDASALFASEDALELAPSATTLLVWREPPKVFHRVVDDKEAALLALVQRGTVLGVLCDELAGTSSDESVAQEVFALVGRWLADGLLVDSLPEG